jgi:acyl-[acyl carrier protein]--UDP-N-acetylglucosamine O-acyltransferase
VIHKTAIIGDPPEHRAHVGAGIPPRIHDSARVEAFVTVDAGIHQPTHIGERVWLMKKAHVGHDAFVDDDAEIAPLCSIGGHVQLGKRVRVGQGATFKPFVKVGDDARIGMGAVVICDIPSGEVWAGNPARMIHPAGEPMMTEAEVEGWEEWWAASRA